MNAANHGLEAITNGWFICSQRILKITDNSTKNTLKTQNNNIKITKKHSTGAVSGGQFNSGKLKRALVKDSVKKLL